MCLGIPGQIVSIDGHTAMVEFWGTLKPVRLDILEQPVRRGDYVINHSGVAVRRIPPHEVVDTLALYELILAEGGVDPIACNAAPELVEDEQLALVTA
jgi:hydrogenase expression/formation protein HypC